MSKYLDENGLLYLWEKITDTVEPKADKIPEVQHGTSDTTFTLTPNIMHIWGEVGTLNLTLSTDSNSVLDEYMFTFTCPSATATNLTLPASIKWIQQPELLAGKTYQVSIINGLAGYLTDDMPMTGDENIIEGITVNGTTVPVVNKIATITGTVKSVTVNGSNYTPDANGLVNLGTISGESGSGGEYNVIEGVTFNGTTAPITNKIAAITYTAPTLSKGTTTGSGNAVTDISVSGHTVTLTKGTTFLTSHQDISGKANDTDVVHKTGYEIITGSKTITNQLNFNPEGTEYDNYITSASGTLILKGEDGININGDLNLINGSSISVDNIYAKTTANRSNAKIFTTNGNIIDLPALSKGTTTGSGNAVTDISVSGHLITLTKGSTFLQSGASSDDIKYSEDQHYQTTYFLDGVNLTLALLALDEAVSTKSTDLQSELNLKENSSHKVTSISSSSTNTQYPSALAVYNFGTNLVSQLTTIYSGSGAPASSLGNNGDIYIKVT